MCSRVSRSQLQWGKRKNVPFRWLEACHFSRPCAGIVALSMSDVALLRRRNVLSRFTFALQIHCDSRFRSCRFEAFCLECACKRFLECHCRWPCRTIGSFSQLQIFKKSVEIILALQFRASFPRAMRRVSNSDCVAGAFCTLPSFFVTGAALSSCSCRFRGRRSTLEFSSLRANFVAGAAR